MNVGQSCVMWWIVAAGVAMAGAQGPTPEVRKRVDAFVEALASGDAARFEAMAQERDFTRRSPDNIGGRRRCLEGEFRP